MLKNGTQHGSESIRVYRDATFPLSAANGKSQIAGFHHEPRVIYRGK
jgi:hypothetical protein